MREARYLRTPGGWPSDARLYRLSEPVTYAGPYGPGLADHVIVAVGTVPADEPDAPGRPYAAVWAANEHAEAFGPVRLSEEPAPHAAVLARLGFVVVGPDGPEEGEP